ncbi:hypothetical protein C8F04DRAFT_1267319 [Mycena alexandri]|uniref:Uncharacterized protein n=1 Tax=Mycena alexandri TaxID=1745969 RepID=A0AAD6SGR0_9AGAR|nr:hypothetical protein C8F04DRAFT_1267319 [Mycena alexandri]
MSLCTRAVVASTSPEGPAVSSLKRGRSPEGLVRVPSPVPVAKVPAKKRARVKTEEAKPESDHDDDRVRVKHMPNRSAGSVVPEYDYSVNKPSVVNALAKALDSTLKLKNRISSAEIQASDTGFNVAADVPTDNGLLYVIRTKPVISMHHDLQQTTPIGPSGSDRAPSSRSASDRRSNGTTGALTKHRNESPLVKGTGLGKPAVLRVRVLRVQVR